MHFIAMFLFTTIRETIRWKTHKPQHLQRVVLILPVSRFRKRRSNLATKQTL